MTNLIISRHCNQSCSYCFAGDQISTTPDYLSIDAFEQRLDYLDRSGIIQARFLGGEPTLHPQFPELVQRAVRRGKKIIVFTNGLMPLRALAALEALDPDTCSIILNISSTGSISSSTKTGQRKEILKRLGGKIQPGCNIFRTDHDLESIIQLIIESGCKKSIRVGIAEPTIDGKNTFLPTRHYAQVGTQISHLAQRAAQEGIRIELDCGFVRCMFSEEAINTLSTSGVELNLNCGPIVDIDTNGKIYHCFPLATKFSGQFDPEHTAADYRTEFQKKTEPYRQIGIYKTCSVCRYKNERICSGGCLAHTIRRFSTKPISITMQYEL